MTRILSTPGHTLMLNAYDGSTDIVVTFHADDEIAYDHRDADEQRRILLERSAAGGEAFIRMVEKAECADDLYFDKLSQTRMPTWVSGRVALVGDAGYCASPAAGMGGSLAILGATALHDAFATAGGDIEAAFREYENELPSDRRSGTARRRAHRCQQLLPRDRRPDRCAQQDAARPLTTARAAASAAEVTRHRTNTRRAIVATVLIVGAAAVLLSVCAPHCCSRGWEGDVPTSSSIPLPPGARWSTRTRRRIRWSVGRAVSPSNCRRRWAPAVRETARDAVGSPRRQPDFGGPGRTPRGPSGLLVARTPTLTGGWELSPTPAPSPTVLSGCRSSRC